MLPHPPARQNCRAVIRHPRSQTRKRRRAWFNAEGRAGRGANVNADGDENGQIDSRADIRRDGIGQWLWAGPPCIMMMAPIKKGCTNQEGLF